MDDDAARPAGGPEVWLLHGQPDSAATWQPVRHHLVARWGPGRRVRALDRPGYGRNPAGASGYDGNVRWLRDELDRHGGPEVVLVAHSWAGGVAVLAAATDPRVRALVLAASVGPHCLIPRDQLLAAPLAGEVLAWTALRAGRPVLRRAVRRRLAGDVDPADVPFARTSAWGNGTRPVWRTFLTEQRSLLRDLTRVEAALPELTVPVLVVAGRHDRTIPEATTAALVDRVRDARRVDLEAGHVLHVTAARPLAEAVAGFVDAQVAGRDRPGGGGADATGRAR